MASATHDAARARDRAARRSFRLTRLTLGVVGVVLILIGGWQYATSYAPFAPTAALGFDGAQFQFEDVYDPPQVIVSYRDRGEIGLVIGLTNARRFGVTVHGVELLTPGEPLLLPVELLLAAPDGPATLDDAQAADTIEVPAGETTRVVLRAVFSNCEKADIKTLSPTHQIRVSYSVFGIDTEQIIDLDRVMVVRSPILQGCPERAANRSRGMPDAS